MAFQCVHHDFVLATTWKWLRRGKGLILLINVYIALNWLNDYNAFLQRPNALLMTFLSSCDNVPRIPSSMGMDRLHVECISSANYLEVC